MAEEAAPASVLVCATATGVRIMGLRISAFAAGFVASVLIARALGPTGRGLYAYPVALLGMVLAFGHFGLELSQIYMAAQGRDLRRMWANATAFSVMAGIACWAVVGGALTVDPRLAGGLPLSWIAVPLGSVPLVLANGYWASLLRLDGRLMAAAWATWFGIPLQAAAIGALYLTHQLTPFRALALQWLMSGSSWLLLLAACHRARLASVRVDPALLRQSVTFGLKVCVAQFFFFLVQRVDQVLVRGYNGYHQLGLYALAATVSELLWLLAEPLATSLVPHQVRARAGQDWHLSFAMARLILWVSGFAAALAWLLAPYAIRVVYGAGFAGAAQPLRILLPGVVALVAARPLRTMLIMEGRAAVLSAMELAALGLNIALNVLLLPRIGIAGAGIASTACYVLSTLGYAALARRQGVAGWRDMVPRVADLRLLGPEGLGRRANWRQEGFPAGAADPHLELGEDGTVAPGPAGSPLAQ